jgi:Xaa-Pro aminopeptidase
MGPFIQRRDKLVRRFAEEGIDALLITSVPNVTYLTGFTGDSSFLVLTKDRAILVSDPRYTRQIADECGSLATHIRPPSQKVHEAAAEVLVKLGSRFVGFESGALTVAEYETFRGLAPTLSWKGAADRVEQLRMVKDAVELDLLCDAVEMAERAFVVFRNLLRAEDNEKDLCDALEGYIRRVGGKESSFPPIVAVGERAALPHAPPTGRAVSSGGLLLVDWGVNGGLYKSDLTRVLDTRTNSTFVANKGDTTKLEKIYAVVLSAQQAAIRAVRPGVQAQTVDAAARAVITEAGYGEYFGHGLGHGIGLQVHEAPAIRHLSTTVLQPGMVFTIEPGIYLPEWGGVRIEDDVLVTADGCEVLSQLTRDLTDLRAFA